MNTGREESSEDLGGAAVENDPFDELGEQQGSNLGRFSGGKSVACVT